MQLPVTGDVQVLMHRCSRTTIYIHIYVYIDNCVRVLLAGRMGDVNMFCCVLMLAYMHLLPPPLPCSTHSSREQRFVRDVHGLV